ncbi:MAG: bifunctional alpha/beta hydrolase/OsmC family protein [Pseudomonadales bacterium]|jgi:putative redox protein|nr:bifunctional alpha/beta hydrolase/OsmC family protein [Pseudomonadales bacterium]
MSARPLRVAFPGADGQELAASLTLPEGIPRTWALFAHCFTCGKDSLAAARLAGALAARGVAVLRFDFTGLGASEGDFANTHFTSNVEDLVAAAHWLAEAHEGPTLLVGHSLGGTAVLAAAERIPSARAVVTIGAPADPAHVLRQFGDAVPEIERDGSAEVDLGGRPFRIRRSFLEDLRAQRLEERVGRLRRALLVLHAPGDPVVSVDEASRIFLAAKHPKSFVSLDDADHLLTRRADAEYVAEVVAAWAARYVSEGAAPAPERPAVGQGALRVEEGDRKFLRRLHADDHSWLADEPEAVGGGNRGPDPYELLLASLGACTSMTLRSYANRKRWPLDDVVVELSHRREHAADCEACEEAERRVEVLARRIHLVGDLDPEQRARLLEIADRCSVHRTLEGELQIRTEASDEP